MLLNLRESVNKISKKHNWGFIQKNNSHNSKLLKWSEFKYLYLYSKSLNERS